MKTYRLIHIPTGFFVEISVEDRYLKEHENKNLLFLLQHWSCINYICLDTFPCSECPWDSPITKKTELEYFYEEIKNK